MKSFYIGFWLRLTKTDLHSLLLIKALVFLAALQAGLVSLAVIGVVMSVVGAFYYLRIIRLMYFEDTDNPLDPGVPATNRVVLGVSLLVVLLFFVGLGSLLEAADSAAMALVASG